MRWIMLLTFVVALGCSQQPVRGTHLQMTRSVPQQRVLLVVDGDGNISYGGGLDALEGKTSWQGEMTSQQRDQFDAAIASSDWLTVEGNSVPHNVQGFRIRIQRGTIDNSFTLPLTDRSATVMYELLQSIAIARLEPTLNALPKPSMNTIIDRKVSGMADQ